MGIQISTYKNKLSGMMDQLDGKEEQLRLERERKEEQLRLER